MITNSLLTWLIETVLAVSALMVLVLLIRRPVARFAGPKWAYWLWAVPALRFGFSLMPEGVVSTLAVFDSSLGSRIVGPIESAIGDSGMLIQILVGIWLIGAVWSLVRRMIEHQRLRSAVLEGSRPVDAVTRRLIARRSQGLAMHPAPEARMVSCDHGPAVIGIINPVLVLPGRFLEDYSEQQQDLMIQHELTHLKRRDLIWNLSASILGCLFWFNPLAGYCERRFRADQELACDNEVIAGEQRIDRKAYGLALLQASQSRTSAGTASFLDESLLVTRRIRFLTLRRKGPLASAGGFALLLLVCLWGSTFGVSSTPLDLDSIVSSFVAPQPIMRMNDCLR